MLSTLFFLLAEPFLQADEAAYIADWSTLTAGSFVETLPTALASSCKATGAVATPTASGKRSGLPSLQDGDIATLRRIESCTGDTRSTVNLPMANKALNHDFESEILHLRTFKRCEAAIAHWLDWIHRDATGFWSRVHEDNVDQIKWSLRLITNQLRRAKLRLSMSKYMQLRGVWRSQRHVILRGIEVEGSSLPVPGLL